MNEQPENLKSASELAAEGETHLENWLTSQSEMPEDGDDALGQSQEAAVRDKMALAAQREKMGLPQPDAEKGPEQQEQIENTAGFDRAVKDGRIDEAEDWLMANRERGDANWLDHRSRSIFKARHQRGDYIGAKRMVELADTEEKIALRKARLEEVSGIPYDQI